MTCKVRSVITPLLWTFEFFPDEPSFRDAVNNRGLFFIYLDSLVLQQQFSLFLRMCVILVLLWCMCVYAYVCEWVGTFHVAPIFENMHSKLPLFR